MGVMKALTLVFGIFIAGGIFSLGQSRLDPVTIIAKDGRALRAKIEDRTVEGLMVTTMDGRPFMIPWDDLSQETFVRYGTQLFVSESADAFGGHKMMELNKPLSLGESDFVTRGTELVTIERSINLRIISTSGDWNKADVYLILICERPLVDFAGRAAAAEVTVEVDITKRIRVKAERLGDEYRAKLSPTERATIGNAKKSIEVSIGGLPVGRTRDLAPISAMITRWLAYRGILVFENGRVKLGPIEGRSDVTAKTGAPNIAPVGSR